MQDFVPLLAIIVFDITVSVTLMSNYRKLGDKFLLYGAVAIFADGCRHLGSIVLTMNNPGGLAEILLNEFTTLALFVSAIGLLAAMRGMCGLAPFRFFIPLALWALSAHLVSVVFLPPAEPIFWFLGYSTSLLCVALSISYAFAQLESPKLGGGFFSWLLFLLLVARLGIAYYGPDWRSAEFGLYYFFDSVIFAIIMGSFVSYGVDRLHNNYLRSLRSRSRTWKDLQFVLDSTQDALISFNEDMVVMTWNYSATQLMGYSSKEAIGRLKVDTLVSSEEWVEIARFLDEKDVMGHHSYRGEVSIRHKSGKVVSTEISLRQVETSSGWITTAIGRDLTQIKEVAEEKTYLANRANQAQKLESLGLSAGGIAHDFNNLLVSILGYASIAVEDGKDESIKSHLGQIIVAATRAGELADQMLNYSERDRGSEDRVQLDSAIREIEQLVKTVISKKAALIMQSSTSSLWIDVGASQVSQILMNLVSNASDALEQQNGIITISTGSSYLTEMDLAVLYFGSGLLPGHYAYIQVSDTGVGMSASDQEKLFDPFFSTKLSGRGLGMASVAGIVRRHNGVISIKSVVGSGSQFKVYFPAGEADIKAPTVNKINKPESMQSIDPKLPLNSKVLVVEDESAVRLLTQRILEREGCEVETSPDGLAGLNAFMEIQDELDLVLIDCTLPHMSGLELYEEIEKVKPDMPVIFCSGYTEEFVAPKVDSIQFGRFLHKPYTPEQLRVAVSELLQQKLNG